MSVTAATASRTGVRFPRESRLLTPAAFTRVFREGKRSADPQFTLLAAPNDLGHPRLGMAVSRKVSGLAVVRNRIKRQVREQFRLEAGSLPSIDIVVMAKRPAAEADNALLRTSLAGHWQRLTKRCDAS